MTNITSKSQERYGQQNGTYICNINHGFKRPINTEVDSSIIKAENNPETPKERQIPATQ